MTKPLHKVLLPVAALIATVVFCVEKPPDSLCNPTVTVHRGDCFVYQGKRQKLVTRMLPIRSGDTLVSAYNGKLKIAFNDSDYVVLNANSKAVIWFDNKLNVVVTILHGKVYANVVILPRKGSFKTRTAKISTSVKGTAFTVEVDSEETVISVLEGKVSVTDKDSLCPILVREGERAVVNPGRFPCRIQQTSFTELKILVDWVGKSQIRLREVSRYSKNPSYVRKLAQLNVLPPNISSSALRDLRIEEEEEEKAAARPRGVSRDHSIETVKLRTGSVPKSLVLNKRTISDARLRSPELIQQTIGGSLIPLVKILYTRELRKRGDFEGRVLIRFSILPNGRVVNPVIVSSSTQQPEFDEVVKARVCDLRFEPVRDMDEMSIVYPFDFKME